MKKYTVIGCGVAGTTAAYTLLKKGYEVELIDIGDKDEPSLPSGSTFQNCRQNLVSGFPFVHGVEFESFDDDPKELFEIPKIRKTISKQSVYNNVKAPNLEITYGNGLGGLGVAWGANLATFDDKDLSEYPFRFNEIKSHYISALKLMGLHLNWKISGANFPCMDPSMPQVNLPPIEEEEKQLLLDLESYNNKKFTSGYSALAIRYLTNKEKGCKSCGLCTWGCPENAIYSPVQIFNKCMKLDNFKYNKMTIDHFNFNGRHIVSVTGQSADKKVCLKIDNLILAAGAINSGIIFLSSILKGTERCNKIKSLSFLDTKCIKIPFIHLGSINAKLKPHSIQFNRLSTIMRFGRKSPSSIQVETLKLKALVYYRIINKIFWSKKISLMIFRKLSGCLFVSTMFFPDQPSNHNYLEVSYNTNGERLVKINYGNTWRKILWTNKLIFKLQLLLIKCRCLLIPGYFLNYKNGSGIHYAGTIPFRKTSTSKAVDQNCKAYDFDNLYVVDASSFPTLPSKSLTLTIMANAIRVCSKL